MKHEEKKILQAAIDKWGGDMQVRMALEEMAELSKALLKFGRASDNHADEQQQLIDRYENVLEEIADVQIMLDQMRLLYGGNGVRLAYYRQLKLDRLKNKLNL